MEHPSNFIGGQASYSLGNDQKGFQSCSPNQFPWENQKTNLFEQTATQSQHNLFQMNNNNNYNNNNLFQVQQSQHQINGTPQISQFQQSQEHTYADNNSMIDEKQRETNTLRHCITQMMSKRQQQQSSRKRKDMIQEHRVKFIEATLEKMQQEECDYFTSEEFEYHVCLNIDRLIQEHEEEEMRKFEQDEELRKAEEAYFREQLEWTRQQNVQDVEQEEEHD